MGRDAECECIWGDRTAAVRALLETGELILRGDLRKRISFQDMQRVRAERDRLCFMVGGEPVSLTLGNTVATRWASAITSPPTLASKLGITIETSVQMLGAVDDETLRLALGAAAKVSDTEGELILARVDTPADLESILQKTESQRERGVPIWIVYSKGPGHPLSENSVLRTVRACNMVDTKTAAVSARLTALRFSKRVNR